MIRLDNRFKSLILHDKLGPTNDESLLSTCQVNRSLLNTRRAASGTASANLFRGHLTSCLIHYIVFFQAKYTPLIYLFLLKSFKSLILHDKLGPTNDESHLSTCQVNRSLLNTRRATFGTASTNLFRGHLTSRLQLLHCFYYRIILLPI